jgi:hypothetical protein
MIKKAMVQTKVLLKAGWTLALSSSGISLLSNVKLKFVMAPSII